MQPTKKILNEQLIIPTVEIAKEAGEAKQILGVGQVPERGGSCRSYYP